MESQKVYEGCEKNWDWFDFKICDMNMYMQRAQICIHIYIYIHICIHRLLVNIYTYIYIYDPGLHFAWRLQGLVLKPTKTTGVFSGKKSTFIHVFLDLSKFIYISPHILTQAFFLSLPNMIYATPLIRSRLPPTLGRGGGPILSIEPFLILVFAYLSCLRLPYVIFILPSLI